MFSEGNNMLSNIGASPLDLRVSPVVRRSQKKTIMDEITQDHINRYTYQKNQPNSKTYFTTSGLQGESSELLMSSQKLTTESIVITRTEHLTASSQNPNLKDNSSSLNNNTQGIFTTCRSVEIITATKLSDIKFKKETNNNVMHNRIENMTPITREPGGTILKKVINFETPKKSFTEKTKHIDSSDSTTETSTNDIFYTPESTPNCKPTNIELQRKESMIPRKLYSQLSPKKRPPIKTCVTYGAFVHNKNNCFETPKEVEPNIKKSNSIWSLGHLMHSVIALPTTIRKSMRLNVEKESKPVQTSSLLKRCASIAGTLVRSQSFKDHERLGMKRKRTYTMAEKRSNYFTKTQGTSQVISPEDLQLATKRFRIQPRRPIHVTSQ